MNRNPFFPKASTVFMIIGVLGTLAWARSAHAQTSTPTFNVVMQAPAIIPTALAEKAPACDVDLDKIKSKQVREGIEKLCVAQLAAATKATAPNSDLTVNTIRAHIDPDGNVTTDEFHGDPRGAQHELSMKKEDTKQIVGVAKAMQTKVLYSPGYGGGYGNGPTVFIPQSQGSSGAYSAPGVGAAATAPNNAVGPTVFIPTSGGTYGGGRRY